MSAAAQFRAESIAQNYRPRIGQAYTFARVSPNRRNNQCKVIDDLRLGDCLISVASYVDNGFFVAAVEGEFAVIDTATREKGFYEWPKGKSVDQITKMVNEFFGVAGFRADERLWLA